MNKCFITINSPPQSQGRPRFVTRGSHGFAFDPNKDKKNWARLQISEQVKEVIKGPIEIEIIFYMPIPKSTSKKKRVLMLENEIKHQKKFDIDNLLKFTLDSMNNIAFEDDKQIWKLQSEKIYSDNPRTEISLCWESETLPAKLPSL